MSGTSEVSEVFTIAPGSRSSSGDPTAPGATSGGRAGIEIGILKHLIELS